MSKRKDRVAPPPVDDEWELRFGTAEAAKGWEHLCKQAPGPTRTAYDQLRSTPQARSDRQHQLKGQLATRMMDGRELSQWQYEVTGAGRVWYLIDDDNRTLWLVHAGPGHPKATDK